MEKVKYKTKEFISKATGEVIQEAKEMEMVTRPEIPFRSVTDLKKHNFGRVFTEPSVTQSACYVPIKQTIQAILARHSMDTIRQLGIQENVDHPEEYDGYISDDDGNLTYVGENAYEQADFDQDGDMLEAYDYAQELQESELAANVASEHSAAPTRTPGRGESEAVSGDDAA